MGIATVIAAVVSVAALAQDAALWPDARAIAFTHVTVIDGTGAPPKANQTTGSPTR